MSSSPQADPPEILVAEDSPTQAAQLAGILQRRGFKVTAAANGREALRLLEQSRPVLVITDVIMPELDGYGLCAAVKAEPAWRDIPVMLVTTLSDASDVIRGLECGADNFLRKPYEEKYLLSRVEYLLMNARMRENHGVKMGVEITLGNQRHFITSERQQILGLLISTYEQAIRINDDLKQREAELARTNAVLNAVAYTAESLNDARTVQDVAEAALDGALELPTAVSGWMFVREPDGGFRMAGARNVPAAALRAEDDRLICRKLCLSAGLEGVTNMPECELLHGESTGTASGHWAVPLLLDGRLLGVLNLVPHSGRFFDDELTVLSSLSHQIAVALDRTQTSERLENLVAVRTASLEAEVQMRRRTEERLVETLESIGDSFITIDRNWRFTYVNAEAEKLLQCSRADLLGRVLWEELPAIIGTPFEKAYRTAMRGSERVEIEDFHPSLNAWLAVRAYPSGHGLTLHVRDVTEERQVRERLAEQAALIDEARDAIIVRNLTDHIVFWSKGAERLYGWAAAEAIGLTFRELLRVDPAAADKASQEVLQNGHWSGELVKFTSAGERVIVEARWTLLCDEDGHPKSVLTLDSDVTGRKRAERELQESEERYRLLFNRYPHPTWVYDLETLAFLAVNDAAVEHYGHSREEFLRMTILDIRPPEEIDTILRVIEETPEGRSPRVFGVFKHRTKSGAVIEVEIASSEITLLGRRAGLVLAIDVTEKRRFEQQLLRAQRMESIGTLAGGIAHDLNNLLMPIMMGVTLLRRKETSESALRALENIERSAKRGKELVRQVLSFARGVEGSRVPVHVGDVIREVEGIVESTFPKNLSLHIEIAPDLWSIQADPTQLNQVLLNLCVNARDAMPDGGRLTVMAKNVDIDEHYARMHRGATAGRFVLLEVIDDGAGMPPDVLSRVFEPFFTTKEVGRGTGLGLSTVAAIVRGHGGFASVYSEVGKGSVFKVYLPAENDSAVSSDGLQRSEDLVRGNGETILIVDDEVSILAITQQTLEAFGYKAITAEDGAEAIGMFAAHRSSISVIITDMMMPVMDGTSFIAAVRRIDGDVRIIASSGLDESAKTAQARRAGVSHFLQKPYSAETLLAALQTVLHDGK